MAKIKKHPDATGFQNTEFTAVPGKGYVDEALDHRMPYFIPCVWNGTTLEPELMQQPGPGFDETYWKEERYAYTSGNPIYIGKNITLGALTSAATWQIWKLDFDADNNCTRRQGPITGTWDGRAALGWT
jgi:hypothetical protein